MSEDTEKTTCPTCGESKERVAQHWAMSNCGYPSLTDAQQATLDGIVLSGGSVGGNGTNRHVVVGTASGRLARWLADQLGWMCQSVRETDEAGDREIIYRVRTPSHPACNQYERWGKLPANSGRAPSGGFSLSAHAGRVWWALAGGLGWQGEYDSQRYGLFSAERDGRAEAIQQVLSNAGFETDRRQRRVHLTPTVVSEWLAWIGDPVPGVEYKWCSHRAEYRALRDGPETEQQYRVALARAAVETALARTDQRPLTKELFNKRASAVDARVVADAYGSFYSGVNAVSRDAVPPSERDRLSMTTQITWTTDEIMSSLSEAASDVDSPLTRQKYEEWRDERNLPTASVITDRIGWNKAKKELGLPTVDQEFPRRSDKQ